MLVTKNQMVQPVPIMCDAEASPHRSHIRGLLCEMMCACAAKVTGVIMQEAQTPSVTGHSGASWCDPSTRHCLKTTLKKLATRHRGKVVKQRSFWGRGVAQLVVRA